MCLLSSSNVLRLPTLLKLLENPHVLLTFGEVQNPLRLPRETTSERPKVLREWCVLYILPSKCASRQNGVHFFNTSTSKSDLRMVCFVHFAFEMCFAPQPLQHLNFQKCSEPGVFCSVLYILTWTCASRQNGVHFFISHLPRWLRTRRFSEPILFDPPEPQNIGKTQCFATCLPFRAPASSFFWLFLFSDLLSSFFFSSLTLPISAFWSVHIVGSLTSKLPSII